MIEIVTKHNSFLYADALQQMYRLRHRVFVERLGWEDLRKPDGREIDQFDTEDTIYMILQDDDDRVVASQRFLPTLRPHVVADVYPDLCDIRVPPIGAHIYEVGRLCTDDAYLIRPKRLRARAQIMVATMEFALLAEIHQLTFIGSFDMLNLVLALGWNPTPLGIPRKIEGVNTGAFVLTVAPENLASAQRHFGLFETVVRYLGPGPAGVLMIDHLPMPEAEPFTKN
jgi:acyl-homoserine lactone synthase